MLDNNYKMGLTVVSSALFAYQGKINSGFEVNALADELAAQAVLPIAVSAAGPAARLFHGMVQSNETPAFIVDCLKHPTTEDAIVDAVLCEYAGVDRQTVVEDVREILAKLRSIHALDE